MLNVELYHCWQLKDHQQSSVEEMTQACMTLQTNTYYIDIIYFIMYTLYIYYIYFEGWYLFKYVKSLVAFIIAVNTGCHYVVCSIGFYESQATCIRETACHLFIKVFISIRGEIHLCGCHCFFSSLAYTSSSHCGIL